MIRVFERLKERRMMQEEWHEDQQCHKYEHQLLARKVRIWDVPERLRRNPSCARGIYVVGFRADRMVSKEHYEEDLLKLEIEISLVETDGKQPVLLESLRTVLADMRHNLKLFDIYNISEFH